MFAPRPTHHPHLLAKRNRRPNPLDVAHCPLLPGGCSAKSSLPSLQLTHAAATFFGPFEVRGPEPTRARSLGLA